jgi:hypothetical protein
VTAGNENIRLATNHPDDGACRLGDDKGHQLARTQTPKECVDGADDRVQMSARNGPDREDDCDQGRSCGCGVLEQFEPGIVRAEGLRRNARANYGRQEHGRPDELGHCFSHQHHAAGAFGAPVVQARSQFCAATFTASQGLPNDSV